jgi:hypothetical protein
MVPAVSRLAEVLYDVAERDTATMAPIQEVSVLARHRVQAVRVIALVSKDAVVKEFVDGLGYNADVLLEPEHTVEDEVVLWIPMAALIGVVD